MPYVLVAGATGYLGRYLTREFTNRGWMVRVLVRKPGRLADLNPSREDEFQAEATHPATLKGACKGIDVVVSSLGITRQKDGLSYWEVDYQANLNLLKEARAAGVRMFVYVSVFDAHKLAGLKIVQAKEAFVRELEASGLNYIIVRPNGFFSDLAELLTMAQKGRVWLFGKGDFRANPIHGADLARVIFQAMEESPGRGGHYLDIGGPEIMTHRQMAEAAFAALNKKPKISLVPMWIRNVVLFLARKLAPARVSGPLEFFLTVMARDMIAPARGRHTLAGYYRLLARQNRETTGERP